MVGGKTATPCKWVGNDGDVCKVAALIGFVVVIVVARAIEIHGGRMSRVVEGKNISLETVWMCGRGAVV